MILEVYSVFDKKSGAYMQPIYFRTRGEAVRSFIDACSSQDNFKKHPEDYSFCFIGLFDDNTGVITGEASGPLHVFQATQAVQGEIPRSVQ